MCGTKGMAKLLRWTLASNAPEMKTNRKGAEVDAASMGS